MKKGFIMPALAVVLLASACGEGTTEPDTRPLVRFVNSMTGITGSGGFTANGQFANGSALALGQVTETCSRVNAGTATSFGFGQANTGGTALSGSAIATLSNQTITDGGNYTVVATGSAASPKMYLFDNTYSDTLASNQAALRFVNLAPGEGTTGNTYVVYQGGTVGTGTQLAVNIAVGAATAFKKVTNGSHQFAVLKLPGHITAVDGTASTLILQAGSVNTVAIVPTAAGGWQLLNMRGC